MSKPALGRGLDSLLNTSERENRMLHTSGSAQLTPAQDPAGVQLLLRGFVAERVASPTERKRDVANAQRKAILLLAVPLLWFADAVMVAVAAWAILTVQQPIRYWIATMLILVGGLLGCLAAWLHWAPIAQEKDEREVTTEADIADVARIRIRFMEDRPAVRKNSGIQ